MTDRKAALDAAMTQIEKQFGAGAAIRMNQDPEPMDVIPSGSIALNHALGISGYPVGRAIEIYGPYSSGKTTLANHAVASCQQNGGTAAIIDAEYATDPAYLKAMGVNLEELIISQPSTAEEAWEIVDLLVKSGSVDLIVIDSLAALLPRAELENDYGSSNVGLHARINAQAMRKLAGPLANNKVTLLMINQLRSSIAPFGPSETTPGGRAIPFYSSVRLEVKRIETIKDGDEATGNKTRVKVVKNKCAPPLKICEFEIVYGEGISREGEILDLGIKHKIIDKAGAWIKYQGEQLGQGRAKSIAALKANPGLAAEIEALVREAM